MNDKRLGYIILALALIVIITILVYSFRTLAFPKETRVLSFKRISNLRVDDQVEVKGKIVGRVKNIALVEIKGKPVEKVKNTNKDTMKVLVTVELNETVNLYKGYRIYSFDKGILGERRIVIEPGNTDSPLINKVDTLDGIFYPGISDVLGHAWKLKDFFITFKNNAGALLSGSEEKPSFIASFTSIIFEIDTISSKLYNAARFLDFELGTSIDTLNSVITATNTFVQEVKGAIPEKITSVEKQVETIANFLGELDTIVNTLTDIVTRIKNNELLPVDHITKLLKQLKEIQELLEELQAGTARLKLRVKLGF